MGAGAAAVRSTFAGAGNVQPHMPLRAKPTALPPLESLPRPELLMVQREPYHLIIEQTRDRIMVMGSHEPSVDLIFSYFKKWLRDDPTRIKGVSSLVP